EQTKIETKFENFFTENLPTEQPRHLRKELLDSVDEKMNQIKQIKTGEDIPIFKKLSTSKKFRKLCLDREHAIDNYFNHLVNWLINKYSDCETIIVGYNIGWKNKCNMGKKNNRKFYEIPYRKFLDKLIHKAEQNNQKVEITEESYT